VTSSSRRSDRFSSTIAVFSLGLRISAPSRVMPIGRAFPASALSINQGGFNCADEGWRNHSAGAAALRTRPTGLHFSANGQRLQAHSFR